jgi:group I intron endonuclease
MANEQKYLVYVHINKINGKKYVGITKEKPERRWGKNGCRYRTGVFAKAIAKYGWDNFEHKILFENLSQIDAQQKEIDLIKEFRSFANEYGYNSTRGGERYFGFVFSDQTKEKMSVSAKNRNCDQSKNEEYKKWLSEHCKDTGRTVSSKPKVKVIDQNGNIYDSVLEASEALGVNYATLWNQLKGRRKNKLGVREYE